MLDSRFRCATQPPSSIYRALREAFQEQLSATERDCSQSAFFLTFFFPHKRHLRAPRSTSSQAAGETQWQQTQLIFQMRQAARAAAPFSLLHFLKPIKGKPWNYSACGARQSGGGKKTKIITMWPQKEVRQAHCSTFNRLPVGATTASARRHTLW